MFSTIFSIENFNQVFSVVFTLETFYWLIIGLLVGGIVGALPGMGATTGMALLIPMTYFLDFAPAMSLLIGIYKASVFGASVSGIAFGVPGSGAAAAVTIDGYQLTKKGKGRKALDLALYSSITSDTSSDVITIIFAPLFALVAMAFGPADRFLLFVVAFVLISFLTGKQIFKGLISVGLGLILGIVGTDPVSFASRLNFGAWWLSEGLGIIPIIVGVLGFSKILEETISVFKEKSSEVTKKISRIGDLFRKTSFSPLSFREFINCWREILMGIGIGSIIGALPGLGATVGGFLTYAVAKRFSPHKEEIGSGSFYGLAAAESGASATVGPTLIPLLTLGIPGDAPTALIGGVLILKGITPSPFLFVNFPEIVLTIFTLLMIANLFNFLVGRYIAIFYARLGQIPKPLLMPFIMMLTIVGVYCVNKNTYDVFVMITLGILGYILFLVDIPPVPLVIAFILTPMMEDNLRKALLMKGWIEIFFGSPLSIGLTIFTGLFILIISIYRK